MRPGVDLEDAGDGAPHHAADRTGQHGQGQVDEWAQPFKIDAHGHGKDRSHHKLARRPNVEEASLERHGHGQPGQQQGHGLAHGGGEAAPAAKGPFKEGLIGLDGTQQPVH